MKKILFKFDPETAHNIAECGLRILGKCKIAKAYMQKKNYINKNTQRNLTIQRFVFFGFHLLLFK